MRTLQSCQTCNRTGDVGRGGGDELVIIQASVLKNGLAFSTAGTGTVGLRSDKDGRCGEDASVLKETDHI